jgi:ParB family chromosome partitioning protein
MAKSKTPVKLVSYEEIMGIADCEEVVMLTIDDISPFKNHPFKVRDDEKMQELIKSISLQGILTPVTVRASENGQYEMISGHRRMHAASMLGMETIPAIIKEMDDDEATIAMVNANIQREEQLPSEKAFSYKMMLEAMKRKAGRPSKNNACQSGTNLRSDELMALDVGESARSIQRCIRLLMH